MNNAGGLRRALLATAALGGLVLWATPSDPAGAFPACNPSSATVGGRTVKTISSTTDCDWNVPGTVSSLWIVAVGGGGGGGGDGGDGGGGGELRELSSIAVSAGDKLTVRVGTGGTGGRWATAQNGTDGGDSVVLLNGVSLIVAKGGKGGTNFDLSGGGQGLGGTGGSGGTGTAGGVGGSNATFGSSGTNGSNGPTSSITDAPTYYGGGGGGGICASSQVAPPIPARTGGAGGGGSSAYHMASTGDFLGTAGTDGTGGGGGAGSSCNGATETFSPSNNEVTRLLPGMAGGRGTVIVSYTDTPTTTTAPTTTTTVPTTTVVETTTTTATVPTTNLPTTTVLAAAGSPRSNVPAAPKTPVGTITTSTTIGTVTTTSTAAPAVTGTSGAPLSPAPVLDPSSSPFGLAPSSDRHFALSTARTPDGAMTLSGIATGLAPGSTLTIVSQPGSVTVGTITVGPDGTANVNIPLDSALVADGKSLEVSGTTPDGEEIGAVGVPTDTSPAGGIAAAVFGEVLGAPPEIQLARSAESGLPVYDTARRVRDTVALTTAAAIVSAIAIGALGSVAGTNGPLSGAADGMRVRQGRRPDDDESEGETDESEASLSATDANLLDSLDSERVGRGDASLSWRAPGGDRLQGAVSRFVRFTEHRSLLLTRIATDGQWVRAWWGSASVILWVGALLTGVLAALAPGKDLVMLTLPWAIALMVIGMLDAAAGLSAFAGLVVPLLVLGRVESIYDVRTILGIGVMAVALPSIGSAIRPLRRIGDGTRASRLDRVADYLIVPLFLGYAGSSAYASLNGLSGLGMVTSADATVFRNVLFAVALVRLIAEDLTVSEYPQRLRAVHVPVDPDPSVAVRAVSLAGTAAIFLLIAGPFFGYGWQTWVALAAVIAVPVLNNFSHVLPNFAVVHRWMPRGVLRSVVMCYVGAWFAAALASRATDAFSARSTAVLLLMPGVTLAVVDVFAREGGDWPDNVPKRVAGLGLWFLSALILIGFLTP